MVTPDNQASHDQRRTTVYAAPKRGQKQMALYVCGLSDLPDSAKRVFTVMVWHANQNTGQCDPSQALLLDAVGLKKQESVAEGIKALKRAGFITEIRKARPHHSAAYQIQWGLMAELHRQWEVHYTIAMEGRRGTRAAKGKSIKAEVRTYKPSDIVPARALNYPHRRGGITPMGVRGTARPNPPMGVGVNSLELIERNSLKARSDEPSTLKRVSSSLNLESQKEVFREEIVVQPSANQLTEEIVEKPEERSPGNPKRNVRGVIGAAARRVMPAAELPENTESGFIKLAGRDAYPWLMANEELFARAEALGPDEGAKMLFEAWRIPQNAKAHPTRDV